MPAIEETKCVQPKDYDGQPPEAVKPVVNSGLTGGLNGAAGAFVLMSPIWLGLMSNPATFAAGLVVLGSSLAFGFVYGFIDGMCDRWLNNRLICLGDGACAIGIVAAPPDDSDTSSRWSSRDEPFFDNDLDFNLILLPHHHDDDQKWVWNDRFQGEKFVAPNQAITSIKLNDGTTPTYGGNDQVKTRHLHCEIESNRASTTCTVLKAMSPFITAALLGCIAGFWVLCLVLLLLIAAAIIISRLAEHEASAADVSGDYTDTIAPGELVCVVGPHVFDAGHPQSWNEIHPVLQVHKININPGFVPVETTKNLPGNIDKIAIAQDDIDDVYAAARKFVSVRWCEQIWITTKAIASGVAGLPQNGWQIYPYLDGCEPDESAPSISGFVRWNGSDFVAEGWPALSIFAAIGGLGQEVIATGVLSPPVLSGGIYTSNYVIHGVPLEQPVSVYVTSLDNFQATFPDQVATFDRLDNLTTPIMLTTAQAQQTNVDFVAKPNKEG